MTAQQYVQNILQPHVLAQMVTRFIPKRTWMGLSGSPTFTAYKFARSRSLVTANVDL
ncbi:hypothetical protein GDO78_021672 [Eleutherodactylus coqui]|uniref:Uncharacterized protein n=1 Tax=Eleutherodactylus coqui TaxID=57060 RepID=A0A8J6C1X0_ELECQ|nr:hypothetical protein GDO78_021672 [Eleutherodactylus coqui]